MTDVSDAERIARGLRAEAALKEFLNPAFDFVIAEYMRKLTSIASEQPWEAAKITKLAMAAKIAEEVRQQVQGLVADGQVAAASRQQAEAVARLPVERRRIWAPAG